MPTSSGGRPRPSGTPNPPRAVEAGSRRFRRVRRWYRRTPQGQVTATLVGLAVLVLLLVGAVLLLVLG